MNSNSSDQYLYSNGKSNFSTSGGICPFKFLSELHAGIVTTPIFYIITIGMQRQNCYLDNSVVSEQKCADYVEKWL